MGRKGGDRNSKSPPVTLIPLRRVLLCQVGRCAAFDLAVRGVPSRQNGEGLRPDSTRPGRIVYFRSMPPRRRTGKDTPAKLAKRMSRRWRVVLIRSKGEILGTVEAPDAAAAETVAAVRFELDAFQSRRLLVQELCHPAGVIT
jgi:hypothetical protein